MISKVNSLDRTALSTWDGQPSASSTRCAAAPVLSTSAGQPSDEEGGGRAFLASGLSKKRLTVQPFRVKLLLEVVGFFSIL